MSSAEDSNPLRAAPHSPAVPLTPGCSLTEGMMGNDLNFGPVGYHQAPRLEETQQRGQSEQNRTTFPQ